MARQYYNKGRMRASYENYLGKRQVWRRKGYALDPKVDFETYQKNFDILKRRGVKNIAEALAKADLVTTHTEARRFLKIAKDAGIELPEEMRTEKGFKKYSYKLKTGVYGGNEITWKSAAQGLYMAIKNGLGGDSADEAFGY